MNIAVMGHTGMLGRAVQQEVMQRGHILRIFYENTWDIKAWRINHADFPDGEIEAVINCAGAIPQKALTDQEMVEANALGPHILRLACDKIGARLIHVSTDCVFTAPGPHSELDTVSPKTLYGLSKAAGEITSDPHLTLRTSFIGLGPYGLLHDILNSEHITASRRLLWSGHTAATVAKYLVLLAEKKELAGLLHMPGEFISRYSLCLELQAHFNTPVTILEDNSFAADRRLVSNRWSYLNFPQIPTLADQLKEYIP